MDRATLLTLKLQINDVKSQLIQLGMTIEDGVYKAEDLEQVVTQCIIDLEEIDDSLNLRDKNEV
jgi:hypothetical protein